MSQHQTILRLLNDCVPVELFQGPTGAPAVDLLPELAQHINTTLSQELDSIQRDTGISMLRTLARWTDVLEALFRNRTGRLDPIPPEEFRRRQFLQAILAGLSRFGLIPTSTQDWLAVLPPFGVSDPESRIRLGHSCTPVWLWQAGYRRQSWELQTGDQRVAHLAHRLLDADILAIQRRARELNLPEPKLTPHVWILEGTVHDVPLTQRIRERGRSAEQDPRSLVPLVRAAVRALAQFHTQGNFHGDLRPACLVVTSPDVVELHGAVEAVLVQTALHRQRESPGRCILLHEALQGEGSLLYASPQVQRGTEATPSDDVYSLATIIYQLFLGDLLAGRPGGSGWREDLRTRGCPTWLADILDACWSPSPSDRPRDGADLLEMIEEHLESAPLEMIEGPFLIPFADPTRYTIQAAGEWQQGRSDVALRYLERALQFGPLIPALMLRAQIGFSLGRYAEAIQDCTTVLNRDPTQHFCRALRGAAYSRQGQHQQGVSDLTEALPHLQPEGDWYGERAQALLALGRDEEAWADSEEALALNSRNVLALQVRGELHRRNHRHVEAIADCSLALEVDPTLSPARRTRALARAVWGDYSEALADFAEELRKNPEDIQLLLARAEMYLAWRHPEEAAADFQRVLSLAPGNVEAQKGLARCRGTH
jgi:tetratricopeptide (TPR) repeat protein